MANGTLSISQLEMLSLNGTGIATLQPPDTDTDRTLTLPDGDGTVDTLQRAGNVLQVVQTVKTSAFSGAAGAVWADVPGLSATITPSSTSSKILVLVDMKGAGAADITTVRSRLVRDGAPIYFGDAASNRPQSMGHFYISSGGAGSLYLAQLGGSFLDSPSSISAVTYKMQYGADNNSAVVYINRTQGDRDTSYVDSRTAASIILMEIAG